MRRQLSSQSFLERRLQNLQSLAREGTSAYPHKFATSISVADLTARYQHLGVGECLETETHSVAGRLHSKRTSGKGLAFLDLHGGGHHIQILANKRSFDGNFKQVIDSVQRGDIVGVTGHPGRSNTGELSIFAKTITLLAPCLHMLPTSHHELKDQETRYRQRYLDLILNDRSRDAFIVRSQLVRYIRRHLDTLGFMEVETPMMNAIPGGASARPFVTHHNDLGKDFFLRIAPELYLKQLVIGGLDRVYELGKSFRNEGIDMTHNPEFTTCELYCAYWDYEDLMRFTEEIVSGIVCHITGGSVITYQGQAIDFTPPFRRISFISGLEEATGASFPPADQLATETGRRFLEELAERFGVVCREPRTSARLLDKLSERFLEKCQHPTFITDHPELMSPLAKSHRSLSGLTERFELFVCSRELCNSYTELNDPSVQRKRFQMQAADRLAGDDEAQILDEPFCVALEHGLPPTGGWAIGIDRMAMFLTDTTNIKEVILFPALRPEQSVLHHEPTSHEAPDVSERRDEGQASLARDTSNGFHATPTQPLYLEDSYLFEHEARVLDVTHKDSGGATILLDATLFYPQGGGQPSDTGFITGQSSLGGDSDSVPLFQVEKVYQSSGQIFHEGRFIGQGGRFNTGDTVHLKVDSEQRLLHAYLHSAGHLLDEAVASLGLQWKGLSGYHFPTGPYVEYEGARIEDEDLVAYKAFLQRAVDALIADSRATVQRQTLAYGEATKICDGIPTFLMDKQVRLVNVKGTPDGIITPCGGTHVTSIKELAGMSVVSLKRKGRRIKIFYSVGDARDFVILTFLRHGETDCNAMGILQGQLPTSLNSMGRSQVLRFAKGIQLQAQATNRVELFQAVVASDIPRAVESAQIVAHTLKTANLLSPLASVTQEPLFRERQLGIYQGKPAKAVLKTCSDIFQGQPLSDMHRWDMLASDPTSSVEDKDAFYLRAKRALHFLLSLDQQCETDTPRHILCVSHGLMITAMMTVLAHHRPSVQPERGGAFWAAVDLANGATVSYGLSGSLRDSLMAEISLTSERCKRGSF